ncbi:oxidoreductase [Streptomyces flavofungini]|uniref:oxidoreductase n=1 Tax=Streptomyces flavofungini TaxID=68200 RepID=UPI0025B0A3E7|nr:oxidoreductase [Streptomyces flavofungini]WJV45103.1 oxidoreductase [Streptomyces flavofungini]
MSGEYATFGLAPAMRAGGVLAGGDYQVHREFVDFIVNGRPLLFQLADLDAVSPLASDIPPAIFTTHVRRLLLEAEAPLLDGRYVIYGCPECEGLECGAVTAVIEQTRAGDDDGDGDDGGDGDYVWRDFAWQTSDHADLELNGYHGIGPFRFRGDEYRAELGRLLNGGAPGGGRRVLLIGARVALNAKLAAALRTIGIGAEIAADARGVPAEELRTYGAVAFAREVPARTRDAVRASFEGAGVDVAFVDGLAPIVPLLVAQIEYALDRSPLAQRRLARLAVSGGSAVTEVTSRCRVRLTVYRQDRLFRTRVHEALDEVLEPGEHRVALPDRARYVVARTPDSVLVSAAAP